LLAGRTSLEDRDIYAIPLLVSAKLDIHLAACWQHFTGCGGRILPAWYRWLPAEDAGSCNLAADRTCLAASGTWRAGSRCRAVDIRHHACCLYCGAVRVLYLCCANLFLAILRPSFSHPTLCRCLLASLPSSFLLQTPACTLCTYRGTCALPRREVGGASADVNGVCHPLVRGGTCAACSFVRAAGHCCASCVFCSFVALVPGL